MTFGDRIKFLRKEIGLSQDEFASRMGVSRVTLARYESRGNDSNPTMTFLVKLKEFGFNIDWVVAGSGSPEINRILAKANYEWIYGELAILVMTALNRRLEKRGTMLPFDTLKSLFPLLFTNAANKAKDGVIDFSDNLAEIFMQEMYEDIDKQLDVVIPRKS